MHRTTVLFLALALLLAAGVTTFLGMYGGGGQVTVGTDAYARDGLYVRLYSGAETPTARWAALGVSSGSVRLVMESGSVRSYLPGPGCFVVRNDARFHIRVDRKWLGLLYVPYQTLEFGSSAKYLPYNGNQEMLRSECRARLAAEIGGNRDGWGSRTQ